MPFEQADYDSMFGSGAKLTVLEEQSDVTKIVADGIAFATKTAQNPNGAAWGDAEHQYVHVGDPHKGAGPARDYLLLKNRAGASEAHDVQVIRDTGGEVIGREYCSFVAKGKSSDE